MKEEKKSVITTEKPIHSMIKTGGYYRWDWKFPFRHFVKEQLFIATNAEVLVWKEDSE